MDKHEAMYNYIKQYPDTYGMLSFIFSNAYEGNTSFVPVVNDAVISTDILGNKTKAYTFAITVFKSLSADVAEENKENLKAVQEFMDWIEEQENKKNYPHFENAIVRKIENLQNAPQMSGYDEKNNLAKYMFQCKVTYKEK